jgi:translation initiation factor IF-2
MEFDARPTTVLTGSCGSCGHQLTILQDGAPPSADGSVPAVDAMGSGGKTWRATAPAVEGPPCQACGEPLSFRSSGGPNVEATCSGCGAVSSYVPAGMAPREFTPRSRPRPERSDDSGPGFRSPNARPCRECGGPLRFSTAPDGTISGECGSCGNRFTLPPRREFGGGDRGGGARRYDRGPPRGKFGGRGGSRPYGRPPGGGGGYRRREGGGDRDGDGDGDDRPRRRPRRE